MREGLLVCLCTFGPLIAACGGSTTELSSADADSGATRDASAAQTTDCPQPPPALDCQGCNGAVRPDCENGTWVCPPLPPCPLLPDAAMLSDGGDDAGLDAHPDAAAGSDAG